MTIPDYQTAMLPVLRALEDGEEHRRPELLGTVADVFDLTPEERAEMLPSGKAPVIRSRISWAIAYLKQAALLESSKRGVYRLSPRGREVLESNPERIDVEFLSRYPEFEEFKSRSRGPKEPTGGERGQPAITTETPEEALEGAYQSLRGQLEGELLEAVKQGSPDFFEKLVIRLLVAMGYGGSLRDAGEAVGRSGDEGIDGIIKEDRLGLEAIYIQAKHWQAVVGRPEIQKFAGALQGQRARKGIFITTSGFSREAEEYAGRIESKIVLIDGRALARLMYDHNVGVSHESTYEIKRIDSDFFSED